jgi:hypothetical protein
MFYSVASPGWTPGRPLSPSGALLFRSKAEAEAFAPEAEAVEVAVRFDGRRKVVLPKGPMAWSMPGAWEAPAVANSLGGVSVFGTIPAALVRPTDRAESGPEPALPGFGGWDSLTMALLA